MAVPPLAAPDGTAPGRGHRLVAGANRALVGEHAPSHGARRNRSLRMLRAAVVVGLTSCSAQRLFGASHAEPFGPDLYSMLMVFGAMAALGLRLVPEGPQSLSTRLSCRLNVTIPALQVRRLLGARPGPSSWIVPEPPQGAVVRALVPSRFGMLPKGIYVWAGALPLGLASLPEMRAARGIFGAVVSLLTAFGILLQFSSRLLLRRQEWAFDLFGAPGILGAAVGGTARGHFGTQAGPSPARGPFSGPGYPSREERQR